MSNLIGHPISRETKLLALKAWDAFTAKQFGSGTTMVVVRKQLSKACSDYHSSGVDNGPICDSGERDGTPKKQACLQGCFMSQFSTSGYFTGEITGIGPDPNIKR
jgi:hypothetical protein